MHAAAGTGHTNREDAREGGATRVDRIVTPPPVTVSVPNCPPACASSVPSPSPSPAPARDPAVRTVCTDLQGLLKSSSGGAIPETVAEQHVRAWYKLQFAGGTTASDNLNGDVGLVYGDLFFTPRAPFQQLVKDLLLMKNECSRAGYSFA